MPRRILTSAVQHAINAFVKNTRDLTVCLLTLTGAGVDALLIMGFNVLTAAQTGNTILLAVAIARGQYETGMAAAASVVSFAMGAAAGTWTLLRWRVPAKWISEIRAALITEWLFLVGLFGVWKIAGKNPSSGMVYALVVLAAFAMGIQSAVIVHLRARTTTYVTGLLTQFTTGIIQQLLSRKIGEKKSIPDPPSKSGWTWLLYAVTATLCGFLFLQIGMYALLLPLAALLTAIVLNPDDHPA